MKLNTYHRENESNTTNTTIVSVRCKIIHINFGKLKKTQVKFKSYKNGDV